MGHALTRRAPRRRPESRAGRDRAREAAPGGSPTSRGGAYLVGALRSGEAEAEVEAHLDELSALADTAGFEAS
ncbi:MAG: hypothetical protein OEQ13_11960, partial [Acidobacteriota bacterium]|nr:hypothetical protein [Acidobacteriota bacterium]